MKKRRYIFKIFIVILVLFVITITVGVQISQKVDTQYFYLQSSLGGTEVVIMHISDLHIPKNGISLAALSKIVEEVSPDLVMLTGDIIDSQSSLEEIEQMQWFLNSLGQQASCFAVLGNHEKINNNLYEYKRMLVTADIILLENSFKQIQLYGKDLVIVGINDNAIYNGETVMGLNSLDEDSTIILLAHRPEFWEEYISLNYAVPFLTVAGHAHGGQFRVFGRGVYSPNQGFFPKYDNGLYKKENNYMVVSRGLGDSVLPLRLYNKYHLPIIKLSL